jgi:D-3-phosphoglycerate dehydrogenase
MEMTTIGYDPYITEERAHQVGVELVDFDTLLAKSDYITIHTPLTKETEKMLNAEAIAKMKDGVRIVNCARGGCMDPEAIAEGVKSGKIAGAAIDVYPTEPLTKENNPFLGLFNVVQTPHLGASTIEAQIGVAVDVAYGVIDALEGRPPLIWRPFRKAWQQLSNLTLNWQNAWVPWASTWQTARLRALR